MALNISSEWIQTFTRRTVLVFIVVGLIAAVLKLGFRLQPEDIDLLRTLYPILLAVVLTCQVILLWYDEKRRRPGAGAYTGWMLMGFCLMSLLSFTIFPSWAGMSILRFEAVPALLFLSLLAFEWSMLRLGWWSTGVKAPVLFIGSFMLLILIGAILLLLPRATHEGISLVDALFTSTSAVCVTGLVVLDTGSDFTIMGQWIILLLIQLGGLGMMTFTSFFAFFFRGDSSFGNRIMLHNLTQTTNLNNVFGVMAQILMVTFFLEAVGAILIFYHTSIPLGLWERARFSIFHAVSAFCNAGFSTLSNSLYETGFRENYYLHMVCAILLVIGGLGFPIVFNLLRYARFHVSRFWAGIRNQSHQVRKPNLMTLNSRIVLATTGFLLLLGTVLFYLAESNGVLAEMSIGERLVTSFFGAATPRTAGFNTVDMTALALPTILITMGLMWIGASPGSTGGGIKTSTFALAVLNIASVARNREKVEYRFRRIDPDSVNRAFGVIVLSLLGISLSIFLLGMAEPEKDFLAIIFECTSAYSTVGLSLGITPELSQAGKVIILITMFVGRVGAITLVIAVFREAKSIGYAYPSERILIN